MIFVGIDLAWSAGNGTGLARIEARGRRGRLVDVGTARSDDEIISFVGRTSPAAMILGIDAPIIAPNPPGTSRPADRAATRLYGRFHAGAYPANRARCARPIRLRMKLERLGFDPDPHFRPGAAVRRQLEVFPRPVEACILGARPVIKYKRGPVEERRRALARYRRLLRDRLPGLEPSLEWDPAAAGSVFVQRIPRGRALKDLEDEYDAILAAYAAHHYWLWGNEKWAVLGDLDGGYILGPRPAP